MRATHCPICFLPSKLCLCCEIPNVENITDILIIRHWKERWKPSNTGRMAALSLKKCKIVDFGSPVFPFDEGCLSLSESWLLFPEVPNRYSDIEKRIQPPKTLVVLDGTWRQARRMLHRIGDLSKIPRLALMPPSDPPIRLRQPPSFGMSTIEAIARALEKIEGKEKAHLLDMLFQTMVERFRMVRGKTDWRSQ